MLSNTCKYGIRAVVYIAMNVNGDEKIGIKQIANELNIPTPFLGKILQQLAKTKILSSTKGPHGGFGLAKKPENMSLMDIVEIIDGLEVFDLCLMGLKICNENPEMKQYCPLHKKSDTIRTELTKLFKNQSIGDLAFDINKVNKKLSLHLIS